jgi:hypothetical protein
LGNGLGDVTNLICLEAFCEAVRELEEAQLKYRQAVQAVYDLASVREELVQVLDHASRKQSFGPLDPLFTKEEGALAQFEQAAAKLTEAEERWCALRVALAYEEKLMQEGRPSRRQLN